jgi:hypothetical protein
MVVVAIVVLVVIVKHDKHFKRRRSAFSAWQYLNNMLFILDGTQYM